MQNKPQEKNIVDRMMDDIKDNQAGTNYPMKPFVPTMDKELPAKNEEISSSLAEKSQCCGAVASDLVKSVNGVITEYCSKCAKPFVPQEEVKLCPCGLPKEKLGYHKCKSQTTEERYKCSRSTPPCGECKFCLENERRDKLSVPPPTTDKGEECECECHTNETKGLCTQLYKCIHCNPFPTPPTSLEDWEEEFLKRFTLSEQEKDYDLVWKYGYNYAMEKARDMKLFIKSLLAQEREEAYNEGFAYGNQKDFCNKEEGRQEVLQSLLVEINGEIPVKVVIMEHKLEDNLISRKQVIALITKRMGK